MDEAWTIKPQSGLINELRRRNHDRYGAFTFLLGQAGFVGEEFDEAFEKTNKHEFCFECPSCQQVQPWRFDKLKWDVEQNEKGYIWDSIAARLECDCGAVFHDTPEQRRALSESGRYVAAASENAISGHTGYTYNVLCVWWVAWKKLVQEWLAANEAKKKGDIVPLRQFLQKRLSQPWTELEQLEAVQINRGAYTLAGRAQWDRTILTVDVQKDLFYFCVRTWTTSGESRLLEFGRLLTFPEIERKAAEWNIQPNAVFLDASGYRGEEVKAFLSKNSYLGLNGRGEPSFPVTLRGGKKVNRIFSMPIKHQTASGTLERQREF